MNEPQAIVTHQPAAAGAAPIPLSTLERCVLGGIGGSIPLLLRGLKTDQVEILVTNYSTPMLLGGLVTTTISIGLGVLLTYFYKSESDPFKALLLGLGAPAVFAGAITTAPTKTAYLLWPDVRQAFIERRDSESTAFIHNLSYFVPLNETVQRRNADGIVNIQVLDVNTFCINPESGFDKFWRGVTAAPAQRYAIYIVEAFATPREAKSAQILLPAPYNQGDISKMRDGTYRIMIANGIGARASVFGLSRELGDRKVKIGDGPTAREVVIRTEDYGKFSSRLRDAGEKDC